MPSVPQFVLRYIDKRIPRDFTGSITLHYTDGQFATFERNEKQSRRRMENDDLVNGGVAQPRTNP